MSEFKLCYVKQPWLYFTTQDLEDQWGDDWNDAPYQHNAGKPYSPCWHNEPGSDKRPCDCSICQDDWTGDLQPKWEIKKVAYSGGLMPPCEASIFMDEIPEHVTVQQINNEKCPWLIPRDYSKHELKVWAGTTLQNTLTTLQAAGCEVYRQEGVYKEHAKELAWIIYREDVLKLRHEDRAEEILRELGEID